MFFYTKNSPVRLILHRILQVIFMKLCRNILFFIIAVSLIATGIGIILGKLFGVAIYFVAIAFIGIGIFLLVK